MANASLTLTLEQARRNFISAPTVPIAHVHPDEAALSSRPPLRTHLAVNPHASGVVQSSASLGTLRNAEQPRQPGRRLLTDVIQTPSGTAAHCHTANPVKNSISGSGDISAQEINTYEQTECGPDIGNNNYCHTHNNGRCDSDSALVSDGVASNSPLVYRGYGMHTPLQRVGETGRSTSGILDNLSSIHRFNSAPGISLMFCSGHSNVPDTPFHDAAHANNFPGGHAKNAPGRISPEAATAGTAAAAHSYCNEAKGVLHAKDSRTNSNVQTNAILLDSHDVRDTVTTATHPTHNRDSNDSNDFLARPALDMNSSTEPKLDTCRQNTCTKSAPHSSMLQYPSAGTTQTVPGMHFTKSVAVTGTPPIGGAAVASETVPTCIQTLACELPAFKQTSTIHNNNSTAGEADVPLDSGLYSSNTSKCKNNLTGRNTDAIMHSYFVPRLPRGASPAISRRVCGLPSARRTHPITTSPASRHSGGTRSVTARAVTLDRPAWPRTNRVKHACPHRYDNARRDDTNTTTPCAELLRSNAALLAQLQRCKRVVLSYPMPSLDTLYKKDIHDEESSDYDDDDDDDEEEDDEDEGFYATSSTVTPHVRARDLHVGTRAHALLPLTPTIRGRMSVSEKENTCSSNKSHTTVTAQASSLPLSPLALSRVKNKARRLLRDHAEQEPPHRALYPLATNRAEPSGQTAQRLTAAKQAFLHSRTRGRDTESHAHKENASTNQSRRSYDERMDNTAPSTVQAIDTSMTAQKPDKTIGQTSTQSSLTVSQPNRRGTRETEVPPFESHAVDSMDVPGLSRSSTRKAQPCEHQRYEHGGAPATSRGVAGHSFTLPFQNSHTLSFHSDDNNGNNHTCLETGEWANSGATHAGEPSQSFRARANINLSRPPHEDEEEGSGKPPAYPSGDFSIPSHRAGTSKHQRRDVRSNLEMDSNVNHSDTNDVADHSREIRCNHETDDTNASIDTTKMDAQASNNQADTSRLHQLLATVRGLRGQTERMTTALLLLAEQPRPMHVPGANMTCSTDAAAQRFDSDCASGPATLARTAWMGLFADLFVPDGASIRTRAPDNTTPSHAAAHPAHMLTKQIVADMATMRGTIRRDGEGNIADCTLDDVAKKNAVRRTSPPARPAHGRKTAILVPCNTTQRAYICDDDTTTQDKITHNMAGDGKSGDEDVAHDLTYHRSLPSAPPTSVTLALHDKFNHAMRGRLLAARYACQQHKKRHNSAPNDAEEQHDEDESKRGDAQHDTTVDRAKIHATHTPVGRQSTEDQERKRRRHRRRPRNARVEEHAADNSTGNTKKKGKASTHPSATRDIHRRDEVMHNYAKIGSRNDPSGSDSSNRSPSDASHDDTVCGEINTDSGRDEKLCEPALQAKSVKRTPAVSTANSSTVTPHADASQLDINCTTHANAPTNIADAAATNRQEDHKNSNGRSHKDIVHNRAHAFQTPSSRARRGQLRLQRYLHTMLRRNAASRHNATHPHGTSCAMRIKKQHHTATDTLTPHQADSTREHMQHTSTTSSKHAINTSLDCADTAGSTEEADATTGITASTKKSQTHSARDNEGAPISIKMCVHAPCPRNNCGENHDNSDNAPATLAPASTDVMATTTNIVNNSACHTTLPTPVTTELGKLPLPSITAPMTTPTHRVVLPYTQDTPKKRALWKKLCTCTC